MHGYEGQAQQGRTESHFYGKGKDAAETQRRVGPKQQLLEQMYLSQVSREIEEKRRREDEERGRRELQTTHKDSFVKHVVG